jgi:hypothetical protein
MSPALVPAAKLAQNYISVAIRMMYVIEDYLALFGRALYLYVPDLNKSLPHGRGDGDILNVAKRNVAHGL